MHNTEAIAKPGSFYGQGEGPVWLDNVRCNLAKDMTILECPHRPIPWSSCTHARDAGVKCRDDQGEVKNISAVITNPVGTVMISWSLDNNSTLRQVNQSSLKSSALMKNTA